MKRPVSGSATAILRSLAVPRLHGSPGADRVERRIHAEFERAGIPVENRPFTFSALPGRFGAPGLGLVLLVTLPLAAFLVFAGPAVAAMGVLFAPALVAALAVAFSDAAQLHLPLFRVRGANMVARLADEGPRFLVVAHRDSKSQPLPLALRVGGAVLAVAAWLTLLVTFAFRVDAAAVTMAAGIAGGIGGLLLACCGVGNDSDGALDNASGVVALLRIAQIEASRGSRDVAFLVTDAEEYGLVGARVEARSFPGVEAVINLDGLDDSGPIVLIEGRSPLAAPSSRITRTLGQCANARGTQLRHRGLPPGLLLDHVPFSRAGHHAFTLMRGGVASLARVHRPADAADRMSGEGAVLVAGIVTDALARIRAATGPVPDQRLAHQPAPG